MPAPLASRIALLGLGAGFFLLPFGAAYEAGLLLCWLAVLLAGRPSLIWPGFIWPKHALKLIAIAFGGYILAAALALPDAVAPARSASNTLGLFRLPGFALAALLLSEQQRRTLLRWLALVTAFWLADALCQALFGYGLRGVSSSDRLSGIFGDNLKLGPVLAVSAALLLAALQQRPRWQLLALSLLVVCILLAGTRSGWVMLAVVLLFWGESVRRRSAWPLWRVAAITLTVLPVLATALYLQWPSFAGRVDRTSLLLSADRAQVDAALAYRLPIWETSVQMLRAHPINGVGTRGFRYAYADHAQPSDRWLASGGALHPHQLLFEILCETGIIGLLCWLVAGLALLRSYQRAAPPARARAWPYAVALIAMVFPINTHLAFYSSFWGLLFALMLGLYIASLLASDAPEVAQNLAAEPTVRALNQ